MEDKDQIEIEYNQMYDKLQSCWWACREAIDDRDIKKLFRLAFAIKHIQEKLDIKY